MSKDIEFERIGGTDLVHVTVRSDRLKLVQPYMDEQGLDMRFEMSADVWIDEIRRVIIKRKPKKK